MTSNFLDVVRATETVINRMENVTSKISDYALYDIIPPELSLEVKTSTDKWIKEIREKFDKYFIKQANIQVLRRKEDEIRREK